MTETVTQPGHDAGEAATPPLHEAGEAVNAPVKEPAAAGGEALNEATAADETGAAPPKGTVQGATPAPTPGAGDAPNASGAAGTVASEAAGRRDPGLAGTASPSGDAGPGSDSFVVPSVNGAVPVPRDRWIAYVWPAIALTHSAWAPVLKDLGLTPVVPDPVLEALRTALLVSSGGGGGITGDSSGVAGVQAPRVTHPSSDPSLFSAIPSAIGHAFTPDAPLPLLVFYLVVVLAIIAISIAIAWNLGYLDAWLRPLRRGGRRW